MENIGLITRVQPHTKEWFDLRCGTFTASEIWKLMTDPRSKKDLLSKTAETYILEKVHEKVTGKIKMGVDNFSTMWGVEHEPLALKWYGKLTGHDMQDSYLVFHETIEGFSCTPDQFVNEDGLCEVKCPANGANHLKHCFITASEYMKQEFPEYYWQVTAQMLITGRKWCDFVSFDPRIPGTFGMFIYRVELNEIDAALLEDRVKNARSIFHGYLEVYAA